MKNFFVIASILLALLCGACDNKKEKIRIHTLGDSTMENQNPDIKDQRGWPQMLNQFLSEDVEVINHGKSGTSSKSFYKNGFWEKARNTIKHGDYVLIQFAHNDEKDGGFDGETGTVAADSFRIYLSKYVEEVRLAGAHPVIMSGVVRKMYDRSGLISRRGAHDLGEFVHQRMDSKYDPADTVTFNYTYNARYVADSLSCPFIDMAALTKSLADSVGQSFATSAIYNLPKDGTHFGATGAAFFSRLAARALSGSVIASELCDAGASLLVNPVRHDYGKVYLNMNKIATFDVVRPDSKAGSQITITTKKPFSVSLDKDSLYSSRIVLVNKGDAMEYDKLYIKADPDSEGSFVGDVIVSDGRSKRTITLSGISPVLLDTEPVSVEYSLTNHAQSIVKGAVKATELKCGDMNFDGMIWNDNLGLKGSMGDERRRVYCASPDVWPSEEIDVVYTRYLEFALDVMPGSRLDIKRISIEAGGGAGYRIAYSDTYEFISGVTLFEREASMGKDILKHSALTDIEVKDKIYFRIYPWVESPEGNEKICVSGILIEGEQRQI